jgi:hypothetical protein
VTSTVRTQLTRAHAQLRAKLDGEHRDRSAWVALLAPSESVSKGAGLAWVAAALAIAVAAAWLVARPGLATKSEEIVAAAGEAPAPADAQDVANPASGERVATEAPGVVQEPEQVLEVVCEPAELFDRRRYDDYEKATFSFEHGVRDDPTGAVRNDWDLHFSQGRFRVCTVVDDSSRIVDLGATSIEAVALRDAEQLANDLRAALLEQELAGTADHLPVRVGHTYFVWTLDSDSDVASLFEVVHDEPGERCVLEWCSTADGRIARGSLSDSSPCRSLARTLAAMRSAARGLRSMTEPRVVLQLRSGAVGGNPLTIDLAGSLTRVDARSRTPLDVTSPVTIDERPISFSTGGFVPEGRRFIVTRAAWCGSAAGDSNGDGELVVQIGDLELHRASDRPDFVRGEWTGRVAIAPGDEQRVFLGIRNSSAGELVLEGELEPSEDPRSAVEPCAPRIVRPERDFSKPRFVQLELPRIELVDASMAADRGHSGASLSSGRPSRRCGAGRCECDLHFENGQFRADDGSSDRNVIVELGEFPLRELPDRDASRLAARVRAEARAQLRGSGAHVAVSARLGATYFVWTRGTNERGSAFEVVALDGRGKCTLEWLSARNELGAVGSLATSAGDRAVADAVLELRESARRALDLEEPRAVLQLRSGARGGNFCDVDLAGGSRDPIAMANEPLDMRNPVSMDEPPVGFVAGGTVPPGSVFVVTSARYTGCAAGDSNGPGYVRVVLGDEVLCDVRSSPEPIDGRWTGRFVVARGMENRLRLQVGNSSVAEVVFEGQFEPVR